MSSGGQTIPIPLLAVRGPKGKILPDQVDAADEREHVTFSLCGLGSSCSIATGKPSVARATLVRREILELALYTFKYVKSVKHIVAFMPPPAGTQPAYVVYLQKTRRRAAAEDAAPADARAEGAAAGEDHLDARSSASTRSPQPRDLQVRHLADPAGRRGSRPRAAQA